MLSGAVRGRYDALLEVAQGGASEELRSALDLFSNLSPALRSKHAYAIAMQLHCRAGHPERAAELIAEAKAGGVLPDQEMVAAAAAAAAAVHAQERAGRGGERDGGGSDVVKGGGQPGGVGGGKKMMSKAERRRLKKRGVKDGTGGEEEADYHEAPPPVPVPAPRPADKGRAARGWGEEVLGAEDAAAGA